MDVVLLTLWPLWLALLCVPLLLFSPGCGCCGPPCPCPPGVPYSFVVRLSDSSPPIGLSPTSGKRCEWTRTVEGIAWTLTIANVDGDIVVTLTRVDTNQESDPTTVWQWIGDGYGYEEFDCCEGLKDVLLPCHTSDEEYCAEGVTASVRAICTIAPACANFCPDGITETMAVTLPAFEINSGHSCTPNFCHLIQGTYVVSLVSQTPEICTWAAAPVSGSCGGSAHSCVVNLLVTSSGTVRVVVTFTAALLGTLYHYLWEDTINEESCLFVERALPFLTGQAANSPTSPCAPVGGSASEVIVSAL